MTTSISDDAAMKQATFSDAEFTHKKKQTRRDRFLSEIEVGDAGYQGADKRPENASKAVTWHIAMKRSVRKALKKNPLGRACPATKKSWKRPRPACAPRSSTRFMC